VDELPDARRDLVGVDLVAEQQQRVRPLHRVLVGHPLRDRDQRVDLAAVGVLVLAQRVRRIVRGRYAAGPEQDARLRALLAAVRADDARWEVALWLRPDRLAVQAHLVARCGIGLQAGAVQQRVVVALDRERPPAAVVGALDRDLGAARAVGLDPDRRVVGARVAQQRAEHEPCHYTATLGGS
jgi:hypothetical protein